MTADPLDALLSTITELESDDDDTDDFPWTDSARWCPAELEWDDPWDDTLPAFEDDGCVIVVDAARPWVATAYTPPWWARE